MSALGWGGLVAALGGVLAAPLFAYLALLTLLSGVRRAPRGGHHTRFKVVVPAHNEAGQMGPTIASLLGQAYPFEQLEVVVVADNCTDATAAEAGRLGARVLTRDDPGRRGKGFALEHAFAVLMAEPGWDAVVVVDADTIASANLLAALSARLEAGAQALQVDYGVRNPEASWRTRLMAVALGMFHRLRALGRSRLGVSAGLRGNGMCFSRALLAAHPHRAHGLVEDVEYGIALGLAGIKVAYVDEARVLGEMVSSQAASGSQRERWEDGRRQLVATHLRPLLAAFVRTRSKVALDLAIDIIVPPLSTVALLLALGLALACGLAGGAWWLGERPHAIAWAAAAWGLNLAAMLAYVLRGAMLSGMGWGAAAALAWAPFYVAWKLALKLAPGRRVPGEWVRTAREGKGEDHG